MSAADVKAAILASGIEVADEVATSLSQKLSAAKLTFNKLHFLSDANVEKITSAITEQVALREIRELRAASRAGGAPSAPAGPQGSAGPAVSLVLNASDDIEEAREKLRELQASDVENPASQEMFQSLNLDDLSADIIPPAQAAKEAQRGVTAGSTKNPVFYDKKIVAEYAPIWTKAEKEKRNASGASEKEVDFGSIFAYIAALFRFLLMTLSLSTQGRSIWDVPDKDASTASASGDTRNQGKARRMGRMFNYFFLLLNVAHRAQQEDENDGKRTSGFKVMRRYDEESRKYWNNMLSVRSSEFDFKKQVSVIDSPR